MDVCKNRSDNMEEMTDIQTDVRWAEAKPCVLCVVETNQYGLS